MSNSSSRTSSTVATALRVLGILSEHPEGIGVSEMSRQLGVGRSTAHMLLSTLLQQDFAFQDEESMYFLGLRAFEVGAAVPDVARFGGALLGPMRSLADLSGEAVSLAIPRNRDAIIVQRFETRHVLRMDIRVGTRMPLISCASGKVLLASMTEAEVDNLYPEEDLPEVTSLSVRSKTVLKSRILPEVRRQGYAVTEGEYAEGIDGVAAGITGSNGSLVAALSVAGPSSRFVIDQWVEPVLTAATAMTHLLSRNSG
ncbi:IclR family transcriptional regulator [Paenarthrobacter sp. S56]|uniref:IclR family transcriptional regulator n=1 Tax=Paenarthrobacter sp. S56 TaxID=3138179 RepID=UPI003219B1E2